MDNHQIIFKANFPCSLLWATTIKTDKYPNCDITNNTVCSPLTQPYQLLSQLFLSIWLVTIPFLVWKSEFKGTAKGLFCDVGP